MFRVNSTSDLIDEGKVIDKSLESISEMHEFLVIRNVGFRLNDTASEREGRGRRRDEGTDVRSARDTVVSEVIPAKGIEITEMTDCEGLGPAQWILVYERGE
ncbi:hypothetical protein PRIPAC_96606, partial [Pristionchus pacificus]|uniref:Uncharacterized protein n=1 Tax=Pristionchus pacificus TaxID=54126 RepID=A0A2A6CTV3_PRIPA